MVAMYKSHKRHINGPYIDVVIFNITLKVAKSLLTAILTYFFY